MLLAEDVLINAEIIKQILSMKDMTVDHAENGRQALEMFADSEMGFCDAVLMDVRMPEMDGLEATAAIRALDRPDARSVPVIALTANAFDEDVGMKSTIKATVTGLTAGKKILQHVAILRYYTSNKKVATVTNKGVINAVAPGSCTIYVMANNGVRKSVKVTITAGPTSVSFKKKSYSVKVGKSLKLADQVELQPSGVATTLTWASSNKKIATVSKKGVVKGVKKGKVTITVTTANGLQKTIKVTVK